VKLPANITHPNVTDGRKFTLATPADSKAALVDLGGYALARGDWLIVKAITRIIEARGWQHE
jgi:hypothetical protein